MGYYTCYNLEVKGCNSLADYEKLCECMHSKELFGYAFESSQYNESSKIQNFDTYDSVKWYEHDKDMLEISAAFPEMTFLLNGKGEEFGDFWKTYYHDGKAETCEAVVWYPEPRKIKW